ncbi:ABC transporter ATP-binding protein [Corynebacterium sp. sy039]|uniref:ATP-binding cassette domain-containing protein n=1 Tax=Corynebacterium sp. sy039 TaxID=2599641 RepID=UPI0011B63AD5|nr:ABC transporter ATP-binding protein [Corynebacterium sp. sy039]QDZ43248.1 ABC transporter ATP-binding protein [Corynebacterium sp. sy039]
MLRVNHVEYSYPGHSSAVVGVHFQAGRGELIGMFGENGSGKSTLLKLCAGLLKPAAGGVTWNEQSTTTLSAKSNLLYLSGNEDLPEYLTGRELVALYLKLYKKPFAADVFAQYLTRYDMAEWETKLIEEYSHGMKKKIQLITALMLRLPFTMLDETLNGIDRRSMLRAGEDLASLSRENLVMVVSHDPQLLDRLATRVMCIQDGAVVYDAARAELEKEYGTASAIVDRFLNE